MLKFKWETEFKETEIGEIPKDWDVRKMRDLFKIESGRRPPEVNDNGKFEVWGANGFMGYTTSYNYCGEFLITGRVGTLGHVFYIPENVKIWVSDNALIITKDKDKVIVKFYFYHLKIRKGEIEELNVGSTQPLITQRDLKEIKIPYPSPIEQSRIATVLSWFDDLIENKKRQNEILEKVAMAIFKSWFVDFEPFKDEEFVYNEELGKEIPKGWEVKKLGEFAEIIMGQSPSSKYYNMEGKGLPFIQGRGQYGKYTPETTVYCSRLLKVAKPNDVLVTVRAPVGELNLADREYVIGRGVASLRSKYWTFLFLYLLTDNERLKSYERGTTYDAITREELDAFPLLLPPQPILQRFHSLVEPLFQKIILNQKQIMVLRKIRDALLPKLVFGKLRVEEI